jgi:hypothetical protein
MTTTTQAPDQAPFDFTRIDGYAISLAAFLGQHVDVDVDVDALAAEITKGWLPAALDLSRSVERNKVLGEVTDKVIEESFISDPNLGRTSVVMSSLMHEAVASLKDPS